MHSEDDIELNLLTPNGGLTSVSQQLLTLPMKEKTKKPRGEKVSNGKKQN